VGRTLNRNWYRVQEPAVLGFAAAVLLVLSGGPLIVLLGDVTGAGGHGLSVLASARPWVLFARSIGVAPATTALCLLIGIPLGLAVAKGAVPGRAPLLVVHAFPGFLPPFLLALGWFHLLEAAGLAGFEGPASALFGVPGLPIHTPVAPEAA
jgi:molybdate transport system permease protein